MVLEYDPALRLVVPVVLEVNARPGTLIFGQQLSFPQSGMHGPITVSRFRDELPGDEVATKVLSVAPLPIVDALWPSMQQRMALQRRLLSEEATQVLKSVLSGTSRVLDGMCAFVGQSVAAHVRTAADVSRRQSQCSLRSWLRMDPSQLNTFLRMRYATSRSRQAARTQLERLLSSVRQLNPQTAVGVIDDRASIAISPGTCLHASFLLFCC